MFFPRDLARETKLLPPDSHSNPRARFRVPLTAAIGGRRSVCSIERDWIEIVTAQRLKENL